jgi:hypothetical protein
MYIRGPETSRQLAALICCGQQLSDELVRRDLRDYDTATRLSVS